MSYEIQPYAPQAITEMGAVPPALSPLVKFFIYGAVGLVVLKLAKGEKRKNPGSSRSAKRKRRQRRTRSRAWRQAKRKASFYKSLAAGGNFPQELTWKPRKPGRRKPRK